MHPETGQNRPVERLGVMQPYFFPYLGYFSLIAACDHFVFLDNVQFCPKSWMHRNRVLTQNRENWTYLQIPVRKDHFGVNINQCLISEENDWRKTVVSQLAHLARVAPFYRQTMELVSESLHLPAESLADYNIASTRFLAGKLGINTSYENISRPSFNYRYSPELSKYGWYVCDAFGAPYYINAPGGEHLHLPESFTERNIKLGFVQPRLLPYEQRNSTFIAGLSIIDVLMFNGIATTTGLVKEFTIKWKN
ncbi:MAG: WbqC family protein [Bacteroidota bacterium]